MMTTAGTSTHPVPHTEQQPGRGPRGCLSLPATSPLPASSSCSPFWHLERTWARSRLHVRMSGAAGSSRRPPVCSSREAPHHPDISLGEQRIGDASTLTAESLQGLMAQMLGVNDGGLWQSHRWYLAQLLAPAQLLFHLPAGEQVKRGRGLRDVDAAVLGEVAAFQNQSYWKRPSSRQDSTPFSYVSLSLLLLFFPLNMIFLE